MEKASLTGEGKCRLKDSKTCMDVVSTGLVFQVEYIKITKISSAISINISNYDFLVFISYFVLLNGTGWCSAAFSDMFMLRLQRPMSLCLCQFYRTQ